MQTIKQSSLQVTQLLSKKFCSGGRSLAILCLTGPRFECQNFRLETNAFTARPTGQYNNNNINKAIQCRSTTTIKYKNIKITKEDPIPKWCGLYYKVMNDCIIFGLLFFRLNGNRIFYHELNIVFYYTILILDLIKKRQIVISMLIAVLLYSAYLSPCYWTASDANNWTIRTLFITMTASWLEESAPA